MELLNKGQISFAEPLRSEGESFRLLRIGDNQIVRGSHCYKAIDKVISLGRETLESKKLLRPLVESPDLKSELIEARVRGIINCCDEAKEYKRVLKSVYQWMVEGESDSRLRFLEDTMKRLYPDYCPVQRKMRIDLLVMGGF